MSIKITKSTIDEEMLVIYSGSGSDITVYGHVHQDIMLELDTVDGRGGLLNNQDFEYDDHFELVVK